MKDKIQIVIVDDHPMFLEGVAHTLDAQPDLEVIGQGVTAQDAEKLVCDLMPDILLLDLNIPGGGLDAARTIASAFPAVKIVMLTASEEEEDVLDAIRAGAAGYVLKGVSAGEMLQIIRRTHEGESYVPPALAAGLLREIVGNRDKSHLRPYPLADLTDREREILELVAVGHSNREIGSRLTLSEKTVKHYMTNIMQKLHVRNRVEAALLAHQILSGPSE